MRRVEGADPDGGRVVFAPNGVRVLAGVVWLALAAYVVLLVRDGPAEQVLRFLPVAAFVAVVVHLLFWRPTVTVEDDVVRLRNVLRDVVVPFARLDSLDTRYALRLEVGDRGYTAWAAPAPGRTSAMSLNRREATAHALMGADLTQGVTASAAPNTDSGGAALMVRVRWLRWIERGGSTDGTAQVTRTWNTAWVALAGALLLLSVVAVLV